MSRTPFFALLALGCAQLDSPAGEVDFGDIPVGISADAKADGERVVRPIACGDTVSKRLGRRNPYRIFEFEGAEGQLVDFVLETTADLALGLFVLPAPVDPTDLEALERGGELEIVEPQQLPLGAPLPVDGVYRLVVTSASRKVAAKFALHMQCEGPRGPGEGWDEAQQPTVGDGCRPDLFFVEVEAGDPPVAEGFGEVFSDALDDLGFPGAQVRPVLPERAGLDGHRRFFQVGFGAAVPADALCDVVQTLRAQANAVAPGRRFRVGRECAVRPLAVETFADGEMLDWQLERMSVPAGGGGAVDVALVDTGLDDVMRRELRIDETDVVGGAGRHGHGAAMALYVRQVAPDARMHAVRIMDEGGAGDIADLARGIDAALFDVFPPRVGAAPLVINISAGWPPELGHRRTLTGPGCATFEDEVGAPVRYTLETARAIEAPGRPVTVVAAAGNRPGRAEVNDPLYAEAFATTSAGYRRCNGERARWFFPAEYQHACAPLALGVGAIDARDRPSVVSIDGAEPDLIAPGELVYAARDGAPIRPANICTEPAVVSRPARYVLTGTSVPTAFTTGALARMLATAPIPSALAIRLVRETATPLGRGDVRRLDVSRALDAMGCRPLLRCAANGRSCRGALSRCALSAPKVAATEPAWPVAYDAEDRCRLTDATADTWEDQLDCPRIGCDWELLGDRHSSGYVGPSPDWPGCPDCALFESGALHKLVATPYPGLGASTLLKNTVLVVGDGSSVVYRSLSGTWTPGVTRVLTLSLPSHLDRSKLAAKFVTTVLQPGKSPVRDVSGLRVY